MANQQLRDSNLLLQGKCETLLEDLSVKEARWTQREEQLKAEVASFRFMDLLAVQF